ncbi:MAG TPA: flavodoxin family protein [Bryobacteraceae bacterium]|nr:flavodoxin family protein [Bryobacteraceae bacterium]
MLSFLFLAAALATPAEAPLRILIAYHSETGNTAKLAQAVREGAAAVGGVEVTMRKTAEVTGRDMTSADAVLVGTPVYWGSVSGETKSFLDRLANTLRKARPEMGEGRLAGVFCTGGAVASGKDLARLTAIAAFLAMRFAVVGGVDSEGYGILGPQATTVSNAPNASELTEATAFGQRFARVARRLRP